LDLHAGPRLKGSQVSLVGALGTLALLSAIAGAAVPPAAGKTP